LVEKLGTRDVYGKTLAELGETNKDIVALCADLAGSTKVSEFGKKFPDRLLNIGVAEQDMMGMAAGLAAAGKIPFASTFAVFATGRAWEQIRQSICLPKFNVKIVATHGGITVGPDGASHHSVEDIGLMRGLPNMQVIVPCDGHETKSVIEFAVQHNGPLYIRLSREKFPVIYDENCVFEMGKASLVREGNDLTFIMCGIMVHIAMEASKILHEDGIEVRVINSSSIKPLDKNLILAAAKETGAIITGEEHSIINGLGSAVAELLSENCPVHLKRVGINDCFGQSGSSGELMEHYGLTPEALVKTAKNILKKKQDSPSEKLYSTPVDAVY
jgi:transketolase